VIRVGLGYDSHRFQPPGPLILGAICQALTDAILGAAGEGDIGDMFSDRDPANLGRDSVEMLAVAVKRVQGLGFQVQQADVTVVTESPRLSQYKDAMRERLAGALGVPVANIGVKAKTNEGLGWIGRGEGIACFAVATLTSA
jgi:2-C-methyl-D-erythritol 2,4-cyclodiphosphate synthase